MFLGAKLHNLSVLQIHWFTRTANYEQHCLRQMIHFLFTPLDESMLYTRNLNMHYIHMLHVTSYIIPVTYFIDIISYNIYSWIQRFLYLQHLVAVQYQLKVLHQIWKFHKKRRASILSNFILTLLFYALIGILYFKIKK